MGSYGHHESLGSSSWGSLWHQLSFQSAEGHRRSLRRPLLFNSFPPQGTTELPSDERPRHCFCQMWCWCCSTRALVIMSWAFLPAEIRDQWLDVFILWFISYLVTGVIMIWMYSLSISHGYNSNIGSWKIIGGSSLEGTMRHSCLPMLAVFLRCFLVKLLLLFSSFYLWPLAFSSTVLSCTTLIYW